jgi:thiosulfate dehydrogenase
MKIRTMFTAVIFAAMSASFAYADDDDDYAHSPEAQDFIHGEPEYPSEDWVLAAGGRIYDNWWVTLDRDEPVGTNPAYPTDVNAEQSGTGTWRCKECHGWDYRGDEGVYGSGSHYTGIAGIDGAIGLPVLRIMAVLRDENHPYTEEMINDTELERVASFVSRGQVDVLSFIDPQTRTLTRGDVNRGRAIFQTVCAACHGFDGRLLDWGDGDNHNYVGTEAAELPDEVFHKIYSAHPGVQMVNLRAFDLEDAINVLAYAATLPVGPPNDE